MTGCHGTFSPHSQTLVRPLWQTLSKRALLALQNVRFPGHHETFRPSFTDHLTRGRGGVLRATTITHLLPLRTLSSRSLDVKLDQNQVFQIPNLGAFHHTVLFCSHGIYTRVPQNGSSANKPQEEFYIHTRMANYSAAPWSADHCNTMVVED